MAMDFMLRYRGPISGSRTNAVSDKHAVRTKLHPQLKKLCEREEVFKDCLRPDLLHGTIKRGKVSFIHDALSPANNALFCRVPVGGFEFVPLIHREHYLACQVDITWLRRERAGDLLSSGDLDNLLKILFDGLRMPHEKKEIGNSAPKEENERVYCLLEDDSLITKFSVSTYQMLEAQEKGERENDVDLLLHVTVQSTRGIFGNYGL